MDLTQDKIDLIGKIIKNDRKYSNNEDLFDDFFNVDINPIIKHIPRGFR